MTNLPYKVTFDNSTDYSQLKDSYLRENIEKIYLPGAMQKLLPDRQEQITPQEPKNRKPPHKITQAFYNLPMGRKIQLVAGLTAISLTAIFGLGSAVLTRSLRAQLINQAKSRLSLTAINYNAKVEDLVQLFKARAQNPTIIAAARAHERGKQVEGELLAGVEKILQQEQKNSKIEYATLVGKDLRIIANANRSRGGEIFDPQNLVSQAIESSRQITANEIVTRSELQQESPLLPPNFRNRDALIRYTVTPVLDPTTKSIVAALICGDIVNGKLPIVEKTVNTFLDKGYSAVYLRQPTGEFTLATSFTKINSFEVQVNIPLSDLSLLEKASTTGGKPVTKRVRVGKYTYTLAAQALANSAAKPIAVLVYGASEEDMAQIVNRSLLVPLVLAALVGIAIVLLAGRIGEVIAKPIQRLRESARNFADGNYQARAEVVTSDEVGQLARTFNELAGKIQHQLASQAAEMRQTKMFAEIGRARELKDLDFPLQELLEEIRSRLNVQRTLIYRFNADKSSFITAQAVAAPWSTAPGEQIPGNWIGDKARVAYGKGQASANASFDSADLEPEYLELMERLGVKSEAAAPIIQGEDLFGLLVAQNCGATRDWQQSEIDYLLWEAARLGKALDGLAYLQRDRALERERQQKETMIKEASLLLCEVEGASRGDLTVRAEITPGEIGIVADCFNSIIENLRDLVTKVKQSASEVNTLVGANEGEIARLADEALKQSQQITNTLNSVEAMTRSIKDVADRARAAVEVARFASATATKGGETMDVTVESILQLRDTVASTAKKVKQLGESSQQISKVISLINQIALQTNLLAINASIEAARAGKQGAGFAVVAEEVGELATQSAEATKEIEQIVENIQAETNQVVEAMELGNSQVVEGTNLVGEAKQSLEQIVDVSEQIENLLQFISQTTVSQANTSEEVKHLMEEIARVSNRTSTSSTQVFHSLQETVAIAKQLHQSVGTFRVETD